MVEWVKEMDGQSGIEGDEEGNWTYMGANGQSVNDYVIRNEEASENVEKLKIGNRINSDHKRSISSIF